MLRNLAFAVGCAVSLIVLCTAASWAAADFGTPEEAKALLEKAIAAVKQDKAKALDAFNAGEAGFKDRDLYVWCANAPEANQQSLAPQRTEADFPSLTNMRRR